MSTVTRLMSTHRTMIELFLSGLSQAEVARQMGYTQSAISLIYNSPIFQQELSRKRATIEKHDEELRTIQRSEALDTLARSAVAAAETQVELLGSEDERLRLQASNSILDRVISPTSQDSKGLSLTLNAETIQILQTAIQESKPRIVESAPCDGTTG